MAWVESFAVQGLAGRDKTVSHTLDRHLNIFWGLNGAGKTTLLRILHAAFNGESSTLEHLPFESAEVVFRVGGEDTRVIRRFSRDQQVTNKAHDENNVYIGTDVELGKAWVTRDDAAEGGWQTIYSPDEGNLPADLSTRGFAHSYLPITRVYDSGRRPSRGVDGRRQTSDEIFVEQVFDRWRDYASRSLSRIREIQQQGLATVLAILFGGSPAPDRSAFGIDDVDANEAYSLVESFLKEQSIPLRMPKDMFIGKFEDSTEHREVVAEIQTVKRDTDEVLAPQKEFQRIIDSMYQGNKHLVLTGMRSPRAYGIRPIGVEIGNKAIPLSSLSSGEKQLLQILLEVLSADSSAVMIDEPELSLHVNWQQQLVGSMRRINEDCQLLLASHSPEIMAEVPDQHIFEL